MLRPSLLLLALLGPVPSTVVQEYVSMALQADLRGAPELFAGAAPDDEAARALAARFRARFVERTEEPPRSGDPLLDDVLLAYRDFWTRAFFEGVADDRGRAQLEAALGEALAGHGVALPGEDDVLAAMEAALEARGLHCIRGVTQPLYDLMVWRDEERRTYEVELTDGVQPVEVAFLQKFVCEGWSHYATFGRASTGGWTTPDALFCVADRYDLESEAFTVSYLRHEGRHFADHALYPALEQADLEYRAKLTELVFAVDTQEELLRTFTHGAAPNPDAPHSLANHAVVADLAREVFGEAEPVAADRWSDAEPDVVRRTARALLARSDEALRRRGAETTRGVLAR